jgi:glutathione peroxidase
VAAPALAFVSLYDLEAKTIDGKPVKLSAYKGQALVIVNTASKCGYTPQYEGLEKLYDKYKPLGLRVLAFPSNDFLFQEPGSNEEIQKFCTSTYGVSFDLFEKVSVNGVGASPVYKYLTGRLTNPRFAGNIRWNFEKFVIDRKGQVVARFPSKVDPTSVLMVEAVEKAVKPLK